jgi:translocation and assembly module TamA
MAPTSLRTLVAATLFAFVQAATAQATAENTSASGQRGATPTAFALEVDAPDDIKDVLERHLELQRYRVLLDLSDAEIQSLLLKAQQEATDLVATLGYFAPTIRIQFEPATQVQERRIQIQVQPGEPTRVRSAKLDLQGPIGTDDAAQAQRKAIQDSWSLPENERFTQAAWDAAKQQSLRQLLSRRFAAARLVESQATIDADAAAAALQVTLDSGPAYRVGSLEIEGEDRYSEELARNFARLKPGEDYVLANLVDAQKRLTDSGFYDSAYLSLDLESDPSQAVVRAQVKEATMQKWVLGIGASTDTGGRWSMEHTYNQVPGIDWRAVNKVTADRTGYIVTSDWTSQPTDSQWRWAASALLGQASVAEIDVGTQRYRFGRFTSQADLDQSYYLQYERTQEVFQEINEGITNEAATANYAFALRRFDSTPFPTSGWGIGGELGAGSILGSQQAPFGRALLQLRAYQPLENDSASLFNRQRSGRMLYRVQAGAVLVDNAVDVPFYQLFLTGGDTTVRGYKRDEIGVTRDGVLSSDSGRYMANATLEWQRPIVRGGVMTAWEGTLFVDTGAVANRTDAMSFKVGLGVGARWKSPIGPLQMDLAYGVATQQYRLHLNVGFVF